MTPPPTRVVVIDDSASARRWLRTVLEREGMVVVGEAGDGRTGRDQIVQHDPDVVTLDIDMPEVDGVTLLRAITPNAPRPVVVRSGRIDSAREQAALQAGATHVVAKSPGNRTAAEVAAELVLRVRQAARSNARYQRRTSAPPR